VIARGPRSLTALLAALALAAALAAALPAVAQRGVPTIKVLYPEPRGAERITPIVLGNVRYVSTSDLARVFRATKYWRPEIQKLSLRMGEHTVRFTVGAPVVLVDEEAINLVQPVRIVQGVVVAPESIVEHFFTYGMASDATWDETTRVIRFRAAVHSVRQAQLWVRGRVTEVSAALAKSLPARILYATPSEVRVLFEGGTLDTSRVVSGGVVSTGEIHEVPGGVEVRLALMDGAKGYAISVNANRLKVSVTEDEGLVDGGLFSALEPVRLGTRDGDVRTIVIDPGHGGSDLGAALPGGFTEKDVALEIARSLRSALQTRLNVRVVLTRESDVELWPTRRAEIANEQRADLFISIHLDSEGAVKGGGFRVFAQSPVAPAGISAAPVLLSGEGGDAELLPSRAAQSPVVGSSLALAQSVADGLQRTFPQSPVLVRTGRMSVLEPTLCPAIILESAPASRVGPESMMRGYTIYDYTQTVAHAIEDFVRRSKA
jgi:N-acetylmuramoyl-L-alanine amidase